MLNGRVLDGMGNGRIRNRMVIPMGELGFRIEVRLERWNIQVSNVCMYLDRLLAEFLTRIIIAGASDSL